MSLKSFNIGKQILKKIESYNYEAYFVGGCVRDLLMDRSIGDIDIATSASPDQIMEIFDKVIPIGIEHGTVIVRHEHESFEVTTFRLDGKYSDQRHPDSVKFINNLDLDLHRRDFTINALAMDKDGQIIDLFDGKTDLKNKKIRAVGDGYERFIEDPLRIVRALRFSSQLGFIIEEKTLEDMKQVTSQIETIAVERITNELTKLFAGSYVNSSIDYLIDTEVYNYLPIMVDYPHIINEIPRPLTPLHSFGEVIALFHYIEHNIPITRWTNAWKCSNKIKREAIALTEAINYFEKKGIEKWLVYQLSTNYFNGFIRLINIIFPNEKLNKQLIMEINDELPIQSKKEIAISGNDIKQLYPNIKPGPWLGEMINKLEKEIILNKLPNNKYKLKEWVTCNPPEIN